MNVGYSGTRLGSRGDLLLIAKIALAVVVSYVIIFLLARSETVYFKQILSENWLEFLFFSLFGALVLAIAKNETGQTLLTAFAIGALKLNRMTMSFIGFALLMLLVEGVGFFILPVPVASLASRPAPDISLLAALNAIVMAPVIEELTFRGLLFTRLRRSQSLLSTLLISSACFALFHIENGILYCISMFPAGMFFGYAREKYANVSLPIALHVLINSLIALAGLLVFTKHS